MLAVRAVSTCFPPNPSLNCWPTTPPWRGRQHFNASPIPVISGGVLLRSDRCLYRIGEKT